MRPSKACLQCRLGKRRCDRNAADGSAGCRQCVQRGLLCSSRGAVLVRTPPARLSPPPEDVIRAEILELVDLYFAYIHNLPHSLFHEPTFKVMVAQGIASRPVLLSMMALSARFSKNDDIRSRGAMYAQEAGKALKDDLEHVCIENVQACILYGNVCFGDGDADAESLYFALANRMAQILKLGIISEADDGVTQETKLRIYWTCFITDTWASGGSNLTRQFKSAVQSPRVPMDEAAFFSMGPGERDAGEGPWRLGLWGCMVELVDIYSHMQDFHRCLAETAEWDEEWIEMGMGTLEAKLAAFDEQLAPDLHFSIENLEQHIKRGVGRTFIAFHIGYHHYWTLLFYLYLDQRRPPTRNGAEYARRCKFHAATVCDILEASRRFEGAEAWYNIVGHVTVVSSSVLLHTYLFGEVEDLPGARRGLESNFESLVLLRGYWPSVERMINRLVTFQNNCLRSVTQDTHRFDRWMVQFLLEHALTLEEKTTTTTTTTAAAAAESWDLDGAVGERSRVTHSIITDMRGLGR